MVNDNKILIQTSTPLSNVVPVKLSLNALSKLNSSTIVMDGFEVPYIFNLHEKCTERHIQEIEHGIGYKLPDDYKEFLLITNGLDTYPSSSSKIYSIADIYTVRKITKNIYPNHMLVIGDCSEGGLYVFINLKSSDFMNIYGIDATGDYYFKNLRCNFSMYLSRFILTYGSNFWEW